MPTTLDDLMTPDGSADGRADDPADDRSADSAAAPRRPARAEVPPAGSEETDGEPSGVADDPLAEDDDFLDNLDYLPQEHRGPSRLTVLLIAAVICAVGAFGGVQLQKYLGTSSGSAAGFGARPAGTAGGGYPGTQGSGRSSTGAGRAPAAANPTPSGATSPTVVGTISTIKENTLIVTDLAGAKHTVTLTATTPVTKPYAEPRLAVGDAVSVTGSISPSGAVTAISLTVR